MDLQDRYDELDNIVKTLGNLIDEITDKDYILQLEETEYQAQKELDEVAEKLQEQQDREERELEYQYERSVL